MFLFARSPKMVAELGEEAVCFAPPLCPGIPTSHPTWPSGNARRRRPKDWTFRREVFGGFWGGVLISLAPGDQLNRDPNSSVALAQEAPDCSMQIIATVGSVSRQVGSGGQKTHRDPVCGVSSRFFPSVTRIVCHLFDLRVSGSSEIGPCHPRRECRG